MWELKEAAKWSLSLEERKKAVTDLINSYGEDAIQVLSEIRETTVYDEIRKACVEAMMSASKNQQGSTNRENQLPEESADISGGKSTARKSKKKSKKEKRL